MSNLNKKSARAETVDFDAGGADSGDEAKVTARASVLNLFQSTAAQAALHEVDLMHAANQAARHLCLPRGRLSVNASLEEKRNMALARRAFNAALLVHAPLAPRVVQPPVSPPTRFTRPKRRLPQPIPSPNAAWQRHEHARLAARYASTASPIVRDSDTEDDSGDGDLAVVEGKKPTKRRKTISTAFSSDSEDFGSTGLLADVDFPPAIRNIEGPDLEGFVRADSELSQHLSDGEGGSRRISPRQVRLRKKREEVRELKRVIKSQRKEMLRTQARLYALTHTTADFDSDVSTELEDAATDPNPLRRTSTFSQLNVTVVSSDDEHEVSDESEAPGNQLAQRSEMAKAE